MDDRGLNDAAILLMSLGEEEAAEVFKHLSPKEVQKLGETIARMRGVTKEKVDFVVARFTDDCASQSLLVEDASDYVKSVLRRALGDDKASLLLDRILQGGQLPPQGLRGAAAQGRYAGPPLEISPVSCPPAARAGQRPSPRSWYRICIKAPLGRRGHSKDP